MSLFATSGRAGNLEDALTADVAQAQRMRLRGPVDRMRRLRRGLWTVATLCAMAATAAVLLDPPAFLLKPPREVKAAKPDWSEIRRPFAAYAFSGGQFGKAADHYAARRHSDGSRIDTLVFGKFAAWDKGADAWMRISIHRIVGPGGQTPALFVQLARLAAEEGLAVSRTAQPDLLTTRLGGFAVSDIELSGATVRAGCLGYALASGKPALVITGLVCGSTRQPVDRQTLACALDRLDAVAARDDAELGRFFARTDLNREAGCGAGRQAGMRDRANWIDQPNAGEAITALRLTRAAERGIRR